MSNYPSTFTEWWFFGAEVLTTPFMKEKHYQLMEDIAQRKERFLAEVRAAVQAEVNELHDEIYANDSESYPWYMSCTDRITELLRVHHYETVIRPFHQAISRVCNGTLPHNGTRYTGQLSMVGNSTGG